jgi:hypothetical protein
MTMQLGDSGAVGGSTATGNSESGIDTAHYPGILFRAIVMPRKPGGQGR